MEQTEKFSPKKNASRLINSPVFSSYKGMSNEEVLEECKRSKEALMVFIFQHMIGSLLNIGKKWFSSSPLSRTMWKEYFSTIELKVAEDRFKNMFNNGNPAAYVTAVLENTANDVYHDCSGSKRRRTEEGENISIRIYTPFAEICKKDSDEDSLLSLLEQDEVHNPTDYSEMLKVVDEALAPFGPEGKQIFFLHVDNCSAAEIIDELKGTYGTKTLHLTEGAVRARICRMMQKVREALTNEGFNPAA